jgi:hypothetical protein
LAETAPWFGTDDALTAAFNVICEAVREEGYATPKVGLKEAERRLREEFPTKFAKPENPNRRLPGAVEGGGQQRRPGGKSFSDMPKENQDMCLDLMKLSKAVTKRKLRERVLRRSNAMTDDDPGNRSRSAGPPSSAPSTGGLSLKLDAEPRPGFVRRFVNGDPSRILKMERLGYTLVNDRAGDGKSRTDGKGSRITRHAGRTEAGAPMHAVLMETPEHEFNYGVADKEEARKAVEDKIRRSEDPTGQMENAYVPAVKSTLEHKG